MRPTPGELPPRPTRQVDNFPNPPPSGLHNSSNRSYVFACLRRYTALASSHCRLNVSGAIPITAQTSRRLTVGNQLLIGHLTQAFAQLLQLLFVARRISLSAEEAASLYQGRRMVGLFGTSLR